MSESEAVGEQDETLRMPADMDKTFVFVDLETMGFKIDAPIVEIGMVLTDHSLEIFDEWSMVVPYSEAEWLARCEGSALKMHYDTGLKDASVLSHESWSVQAARSFRQLGSIEHRLAQLDAFALNRLITWGLRPKWTMFAGNSLYMDRMWMRQQLPRTDEYAYHRQIDVSSVRELAEKWHAPDLSKWWRKQEAPGTHHRALDDAKFAVQELKLYRDQVFAGATIGQHIAPPPRQAEEAPQ